MPGLKCSFSIYFIVVPTVVSHHKNLEIHYFHMLYFVWPKVNLITDDTSTKLSWFWNPHSLKFSLSFVERRRDCVIQRCNSSIAQSCPTLCDPMDCSTPVFPVHHQPQSSFKLTSMDSVMPSNHLILCCPLLLLPSLFPIIRVFSNESVLCTRLPKYWSFSFSISPSNEYSGLIYFRIDWYDQSKGLSRVFSNTTVQKHQFFGTQLSL